MQKHDLPLSAKRLCRFPAAVLGMTVVAALTTISPVYAQAKKSPSVAEQCQQVSQDTTATWRTIPWQTDLLAAQRMATELKKPLFVWAMDGHPLGCT